MIQDTGPKLNSYKALRNDANEAVAGFAAMRAKNQESSLGVAVRAACEGLIEELLFAGTMKRYEDQVRVSNLEEVIFLTNR